MPRPLRLLAATMSTALTGPALIAGGGVWLTAPISLSLPGVAMAREKGKAEAGGRGPSYASGRANGQAAGLVMAQAVTESAGPADAEPEDTGAPEPDAPETDAAATDTADPAPASPPIPPEGPPSTPPETPTEPPQTPPPLDPIPDPGPDLPPVEVPPLPPTAPQTDTPPESPIPDPPQERPAIRDPIPTDAPLEVPQTDLPPLEMPGQTVMRSAPLTQPMAPRPGLMRLLPYAEQLLLLRGRTTARDAAAAELARLTALSPAELARRYPARGPDHDAATLSRDLDRLKGAGDEYIRLSKLHATDYARSNPVPSGESAEVALADAKRQALVQARDFDTLSNLTPQRRAALYPVRRASHDRRGQAADLSRARQDLTRAETALQHAQTATAALRQTLTGGAPFTAIEAEWLTAYLGD